MKPALARVAVATSSASLYEFLVYGGVFWGNELADLVAASMARYFVVLWIANDARATRYWPAYHYGLFLYAAPILGTLQYAVRTRGLRGVATAAGLEAAAFAPVAAALLGSFYFDVLPDYRS